MIVADPSGGSSNDDEKFDEIIIFCCFRCSR